jgi:hypothetical protein
MKAVAATSYAAMGGALCRMGDMLGVQRVSAHN